MEHNDTSAELGAKQVVPAASARDRWRAVIDEHRDSGLGAADDGHILFADLAIAGTRERCGTAGTPPIAEARNKADR